MESQTEATRRRALVIERLAWHAVATAALALMVLVLLCSLSWLDRLAATPIAAEIAEDRPVPAGLLEARSRGRDGVVASVDRPSG